MKVVMKVLRYLRKRVLYLMGLRPPDFTLRIHTHLTDEEKIALYRNALKLPRCCVALEVGSYLGASACIIGAAVRRRKGQLHCVDTWQNQAMDEPERDTWHEFEANTKWLGAVIVPHRGFSVDVARTFSAPLDFLFIDADHGEEAVDADLTAWLPKVKPGGIVAMHDIKWYEGVRKGVEKHLQGRVFEEQKLPNLLICRLLDKVG